MINVIKKEVFDETPAATISNTDIEALVVQDSIILLEPVKQSIEITYDALGHADKNFVHLGTQYDHRVTWLHFNLDKLIWNFNKNYDYDEETKYNHYTFKIAFTKVDDNADDITTIWEFNGVDFEIPRGITKEAGLYRIVLIIEEYQKTPEISNIKIDEPEYIERFVTAEIRGKVYSSVYDPALDITAEITETDQTAALVKTKIECTLTDDGIFTSDSVELGQQYDNFIRYFKFNPRRITAHLNDFHMFAIFKQNDLFYYSLFETTKADDPLDDYSASYPVIAWIPSGVYQSAGV